MTLPLSRIVAALPPTIPFIPPEAIERKMGRKFRIRIGANENNFGTSPKAVAAMRKAAAESFLYNDPDGHELREALGAYHSAHRDNIVLGAGADDVLGLMVRAVIDPGDRVVMSLGGYPTFAFHVAASGGVLVTPPYRDFRNDCAALGAAARESGARMVYLCNPDNPTGSWASADDQLRLLESLPEDCFLVLDEAYADFAPEGSLPRTDPEDPRLVRVRTFSKLFGMAGVRIGYGVAASEMVRATDKIRNHFGVSRIAQEGALAALGDTEFVAAIKREVAAGRADYTRLAEGLGLTPLPSATNFVAIDMGGESRAQAVLDAIYREDAIFIRKPGVAPLSRCIRVSVGRPEERRIFAEALTRIVGTLISPA